jgi:predicted RNA-binding Zn-ribbon protein involved in translation (DUF1610 family)
MATVRASCPTCGDVELTTRGVAVRVCADNQQGSYSFRCPLCGLAAAKLVGPDVVDLLVRSGAPMRVWNLPAELHERRSGPDLTWDDAHALHDLLAIDGWLDSQVSAAARALGARPGS